MSCGNPEDLKAGNALKTRKKILSHCKGNKERHCRTSKVNDSYCRLNRALIVCHCCVLLIDAAGQKASVDDQSLPGHERSGIGGKVDHSSNELFGLAETAHRRP